MQIETKMRYHFTSTWMAMNKKKEVVVFREDVVKLEPSCTANGNVKWYSCCGKQFGSSSKSYHNEPAILPYVHTQDK